MDGRFIEHWGSSDSHPSRATSKRNPLLTTGLVFLVTITAACSTPQSSVPLVQAEATHQAQLGPENALNQVTEIMRQNTIRIMKQGNFSPTNAESAQKTSFGMGFMIKEIQNDDGTVSRTFGLSRHVLFTGALISKLNIFPISGTKMPILIDQANPTPDYWSVTSNSDPTSESEIATFTITEPTTDDSLTSNTPVEFDTTPLSQGDEILALESTDATNDVLMATTMKIDQVIYDKKGHPIYVAKGSATQGASGGAVWRNGKIVGIIQWGPFGQPDETTIYPFTNEDIDYINSQQ